MKTKYILHGGYADHENEQNDAFFKEILKDAPDNARILLVYFAKEPDIVPEKKERNIKQFEKNNNGETLSFEVAEKESFVQQVRNSDIIYLHGGQTLDLLGVLKEHSNLKDLFKGKIIAGESAGAYVLSTLFYSKSLGSVFEGLGHVPVKTICHYVGENEEKLENRSSKIETLLLPDYEYKLFWVK